VLSLRAGDRLQGIDVTLSRGGVIAGRIVDALGEPLEGVSIQVWRSRFFGGRFVAMPSEVRDRRTDDRGEYRLYDLPPATYYLVAGAERPILPAAGASASKGLPVYYPGRVNIVDAQSVRIDAGASVNGMDIVFDPPPGARVRGRALDSSGSALRDGLVVLTGSARSAAPLAQPHVAEVGQDGSFEIVDVPPGEFLLRLQGRFNDHPESVSTLVTVDRPEVPPLTVRTLVGSHISGRVVFESNGAEGSPTGFAIGLLSSELRSPLFDLDEFDARVDVKADGTFSFDHVSGEYRFVAVRAPEGWWLKSVTVDGINAVDESVTFGTPSASRQDVEVVFSRTAAVITGRAIERREAVNDYSVVVFPTDPARRYDRSRYMRLARSDQDGRFIVSGVPPGEYFVVAVDTIDGTSRSGEWQNPDLLDVLAQSARRLRVGEGQRTTVDLELVRSVN
jgi:hypothetical protein